MRQYRVYLIDKAGHVAGPPQIISCEDDEAAVVKAKQYVDGVAVEIWDEGRRVTVLPPVE